MKKNLLFILTLFTMTFAFSQTTREEYNYLTKGYKIQLQNGLDTKKGYYIKELGEQSLTFMHGYKNPMKIIFKGLCKQNETKPCAILAVYEKYNNEKIVKQEFICIPSYNSSEDLWLETYQQINGLLLDQDCAGIYYPLMRFISKNISK